ncbi:hypothetical protein PVK06_031568 [Gossypium arboreum]|uniref:Uncharacterized protein n=1 Tax=Gossypium arboreum TaxID=29729 RepID=A0ABR0NTT6_GOSAR|nr:hypothetical protein PVK06_031568 [Gossypium arboreum]
MSACVVSAEKCFLGTHLHSADALLIFSICLYRVTKLKSSIGDTKETLEEVDGHTAKLLKEQMAEAISDYIDSMKGVFNTAVGKLTKKNDALEAMMLVLKDQMLDLML